MIILLYLYCLYNIASLIIPSINIGHELIATENIQGKLAHLRIQEKNRGYNRQGKLHDYYGRYRFW